LAFSAPFVPGLFTTGTETPSSLPSPSAMARVIRSVLPPGDAPTLIWMLPVG